MWEISGLKVIHQTGLEIEVTSGCFSNPMDLAVRGDKQVAPSILASLIREGIDYAARITRSLEKSDAMTASSPSRPILKLKK